MFQFRVRRRYRDKQFHEYVDEARDRRQRYGLGGNVRLQLDLTQQTRLDGWTEFQNYHLHGLERLEKKRDMLAKEVVETQGRSDNLDINDSRCSAENAEVVRHLLENTKRDFERHKDFLRWIERERQTMDPDYPIPREDDQGALVTGAPRTSKTRRPAACAVLGRVRVSKATPKPNTGMHQHQHKISDLEPIVRGRETYLQRTMPPAPTPRATKCRSQSASRDTTRRSGRTSRPPVRWAPQ